jgi:hypothetical protein
MDTIIGLKIEKDEKIYPNGILVDVAHDGSPWSEARAEPPRVVHSVKFG